MQARCLCLSALASLDARRAFLRKAWLGIRGGFHSGARFPSFHGAWGISTCTLVYHAPREYQITTLPGERDTLMESRTSRPATGKFIKFTRLLVTATLILVALTPVTALATTSIKIGDYKCAIGGGNAAITGYTGDATQLTVPSELGGYPVTTIAAKAFQGCTSITAVTIPEGITSIGSGAFYGCKALKTASLPSTLEDAGNGYFYVDGGYAKTSGPFSKSGLESATVAAGAAVIPDYLFYECSSLINVNIPDSVKSIGMWSFMDCTSLASICIPEGVESIGTWAFINCTSLKSVTIPASLISVEGISQGQGPFGGKWLESVTLTEGMQVIPDYLFASCTSLKSITIPKSVKSIGSAAFDYCNALETVRISEGLTSIGSCAFAYCAKLNQLKIPASLTSMGRDAFYHCDNLTLYGPQGCAAQTYAADNGIAFFATDEQVATFKDIAGEEWYSGWVAQAAQRGLMTGYKDANGSYTGYFGPEDTVTRAQVATVLWRVAGQPSTNAKALWDARGHWAETAIAWCQEQGIITGYTDGQNKGMFCPDANVTREEFAAMAYRFAKWAGADTDNPPTCDFDKCRDAYLASWSKPYMVWCAAAGIITGKVESYTIYYLAPQETATRAQAAKILVQLTKIANREIAPYSLDGNAAETVALAEDSATFEETAGEETFDQVDAGDVLISGMTATEDTISAGINKTLVSPDSETADAPTGTDESFEPVSPTKQSLEDGIADTIESNEFKQVELEEPVNSTDEFDLAA